MAVWGNLSPLKSIARTVKRLFGAPLLWKQPSTSDETSQHLLLERQRQQQPSFGSSSGVIFFTLCFVTVERKRDWHLGRRQAEMSEIAAFGHGWDAEIGRSLGCQGSVLELKYRYSWGKIHRFCYYTFRFWNLMRENVNEVSWTKHFLLYTLTLLISIITLFFSTWLFFFVRTSILNSDSQAKAK